MLGRLKEYILTKLLKEVLPMNFLMGYKTIILNGTALLTYVLAYDQLTMLLPFLTPQVVAIIHTIINIVLRLVTSTPVGSAEPK